MGDVCLELYRTSTDPDTSYEELLTNPAMYRSVILHTAAYCLVFYLGYIIVVKRPPSRLQTLRLGVLLLVFMPVGYLCRLARAKHLLRQYSDREKVQQMMNNAYFCWYFLG